MAGNNASISSDSYISRRTRTPESVPNVPQITINNHSDDASSINIRRRSAGDLLRRSSAYLRAKFEAYKQSKQDPQDMTTSSSPPSEEQPKSSMFRSWSLSKKNPHHKSLTTHIENNENNENDAVDQQNNNKQKKNINNPSQHNPTHLSSSAIDSISSSSFSSSSSLPPKKIAVNTTILIPPQHQQTYQYASVQPPVITQYPPRPLKYSPVHPILDEKSKSIQTNPPSNMIQSRETVQHPDNKSHHHRISLPIFKLIHDSPTPSQHSRRSSESDIHIPPQYNNNNNSFTKLTKRFSYWFGCQPSKLSKKGKERAKEIVEENKKE
ncbi:unnamed protein product [Cunninghamella blakesleeana]